MTSDNHLEALYAASIYASDGTWIGPVIQVFVSHADAMPTWVTVRTGPFGSTEIFVPLAGALIRDGQITVPFSAAWIKNAPILGTDVDLASYEEATLARYYGIPQTGRDRPMGAYPPQHSERADPTAVRGVVRECHRDRLDQT